MNCTFSKSIEYMFDAPVYQDKESLNKIRPPTPKSRKKSRGICKDFRTGRIDESYILDSEETARKKAWELNIDLFPRRSTYEEEVKDFFLKGQTSNRRKYQAAYKPQDPDIHCRDFLVDSGASKHMVCK